METHREEFYSGPKSDQPLTLGFNTEGETVVAGHVLAQAWHEGGGERELYYAVYCDMDIITMGIQKCEFVNGALEHKVHFGEIYLPEYDSYKNFTLVWRLEDPNGGPAYTGMPQFNCRLRARNL